MSRFAAMSAPLLFGLTLFFSAALFVMAQPMIARTIVPQLGGHPRAWGVCILFFQATLLAGFSYAHVLHRFRGLRWQPVVHLLFFLVAIALCLVGVQGDGPLGELTPRLISFDDFPVLTAICLLLATTGAPLLLLAAVVPLVQRWFAHLDHPKSSDPYFLFAASGLGGAIALVIYVLFIEPAAPHYAQWLSWKLAALGAGIMVFVTAFVVWLSPRSPELEPTAAPTDPNAPAVPTLIGRGPATWPRRLRWMLASALPVGLLVCVTDYLTLDAVSTPFLWAAPLALYLVALAQSFGSFRPFSLGPFALSLVLHVLFGLALFLVLGLLVIGLLQARAPAPEDGFVTFASAALIALVLLTPDSWLTVVQLASVLVLVLVDANMFFSRTAELNSPAIAVHLVTFYWTARLCFRALADDRPAASALTGYYGWCALGGFAGASFQVLIAPGLFRVNLDFVFLAALASTMRTAWLPLGLSDWLLFAFLARKGGLDDARRNRVRRRLAIGFDLGMALLGATVIGFLFWARDLVTPFAPFRRIINPFVRDAVICFNDYPLALALLSPAVFAARPVRSGIALTALVGLAFVGYDQLDQETLLLRQRSPLATLLVFEKAHKLPKDEGRLDEITTRTLWQDHAPRFASISKPGELSRYPAGAYQRNSPLGKIMRGMEWFADPSVEIRKNTDVDFWLRQNPDNAKDDVRLAASLVGMAGAAEQIVALWSEPPIAVIGLGTGTMFTYAHPLQWVDAYELNPAVIELSTKSAPLFHHFRDAKERRVSAMIIPGDARRNLARMDRDGFYQVIVIDVERSHGVPAQLLTQEAIALYFRKLTAQGVICVRVSDRHIDSASVVRSVADKLRVAHFEMRTAESHPDIASSASHWIFLARSPLTMRRWATRAGLQEGDIRFDVKVPPASSRLVWTDAYTSVVAAARPSEGWPALIIGVLIVLLFFAMFMVLIETVFGMLPRNVPTSPPPSSPEATKPPVEASPPPSVGQER